MLAAAPLPADWQIVQFTGTRDAERAAAAAAGSPAVAVRDVHRRSRAGVRGAPTSSSRARAHRPSPNWRRPARLRSSFRIRTPPTTIRRATREAVAAAGAARIVADASSDAANGSRAELDAALAPETLDALRAAARRQPGGDARERIVERIDALLGAGKATVAKINPTHEMDTTSGRAFRRHQRNRDERARAPLARARRRGQRFERSPHRAHRPARGRRGAASRSDTRRSIWATRRSSSCRLGDRRRQPRGESPRASAACASSAAACCWPN